MSRHAVILPPPKEAPQVKEPSPSELRENLKRVPWEQVPDSVIVELAYLLEIRCRRTSGSCFCLEHLISQVP
jgi:hypothetical protein